MGFFNKEKKDESKEPILKSLKEELSTKKSEVISSPPPPPPVIKSVKELATEFTAKWLVMREDLRTKIKQQVSITDAMLLEFKTWCLKFDIFLIDNIDNLKKQRFDRKNITNMRNQLERDIKYCEFEIEVRNKLIKKEKSKNGKL